MDKEKEVTVSAMIKRLLKTRTVEQLAAGLQCSGSTIRAWRDGRRKPKYGWHEIIRMMYKEEISCQN